MLLSNVWEIRTRETNIFYNRVNSRLYIGACWVRGGGACRISRGPVIAVGACGPTGETLRRPQRGPSGNTGNVKLKINSIEY